MKFIFDFDDVLFHTTKKFIEHQHMFLEKIGLSRDLTKKYYDDLKANSIVFSLKKMLEHFSVPEKYYETIMREVKNHTNEELVKLIRKLDRENCYIVTYGDKDYQMDKIRRAELESLFSEIIVVQGSKKEAVEKICAKHKDEQVVFIDDKTKHFENLDFVKYPNLKTILYDEKGLEKVTSLISQS